MEHIITGKVNTEGRNKHAYRVITALFGITVILGIVLGMIFSDRFTLPLQTILYGVCMLLTLGYFLLGMIKDNTADWVLLIYFALIAFIALSQVYSAGGFGAYFLRSCLNRIASDEVPTLLYSVMWNLF
mgnify:FL=1